MNFGLAISTCLGKYAKFSGRASRSEFWWFYLFNLLMGLVMSIIGAGVFPNDPILSEIPSLIVWLALLLPLLAAGTRRLHDIGRTGWWQLLSLTIIGIILLVIWWCFDTKKETNKYGEVPKDKSGEVAESPA